jgi:hypothetical protein
MLLSECANGGAGCLSGSHLPFPGDVRSAVGHPDVLRLYLASTDRTVAAG